MRKILHVALLSLLGSFPAGAATFVVDTTSDVNLQACTTAPTDCSLRGAMNNANANAGTDEISFGIPGDGVKVIAPATTLPVLTDNGTVMDGSAQIGPGLTPLISLQGIIDFDGIVITSSDCVVRKLNLHGWKNAVHLRNEARNNRIEGCFIGTDPAGLQGPATRNENGIALTSGANRNIIGGTLPEQRNVIAANSGAGIMIEGANSDSNQV